jgi:hypothetical protein
VGPQGRRQGISLLVALKLLGEPDDVRIVFGFDS